MKITKTLAAITLLSATSANAQQFYGDPPDENHPWAIHDANRPQPPRVEPGKDNAPPSDAVVLFDGSNLKENWLATKDPKGPANWDVVDGNILQCKPGAGDIITKDHFGDCQLHIEWSAPTEVKGSSQGRGNSGIFFMGMTEVQVLDNYDNPTYADGFAGSVYGVNPPMANALNKPGEFNVYDIIFRRPIFKDGKEIDPGRVTVICNGVVLQDATPLEGGGGHKGRSQPRAFPEKGPLKLQDHGNTTRFRNIWLRELAPRSVDGGDGGKLTAEAATAKRKEIAAEIQEKVKKLITEGNENEAIYCFLESMIYDKNEQALEVAHGMSEKLAALLKKIPAGEREAAKGDIMRAKNAFTYLTKHGVFPAGFDPLKTVEQIIEEEGWNEKK